jgi:hypothetical protein
MHIFLVSDSKTGINFFPELEALLRKKIADLDVDTVFVPFPEDVPAAVSDILEEADLVFVFVLYEELDFKIQALLNKLIEIEMRDKTKVVKVVEESEFPAMDEIRLQEEKDKLAEKWSAFLLDYLFKPGAFAPKEKQGF